MLDLADITLLLLVMAVLLVSRFITERKLRRDWAKVQKYQLYKVRDDFVCLVANDLLREDDFIFRNFYEATNYYINRTNRITLSTFIAAVVEAESKGLDLATKEKIDRIHESLRSKDEQVAQAVGEFYDAIKRILLQNSPALRFYLTLSRFVAPMKKCLTFIDRLKQYFPQRNVVEIYYRYSEAATHAI